MSSKLISAGIIFSFLMANSVHAAESCLASVNMAKLRQSISDHSGSYGDLPSRIDCSKPIGNQKMVCGSDVLRFMEKLDHMGAIYAYENATKTELDHRKPRGVTG